MKHKDYGLRIDPIVPEDFLGGTSQSLEAKYGAAVINPSGDWSDYVPSTENQDTSDGDTWACASFGTSNAVEMLARLNFKESKNLSDRFLAKVSGTIVGQGNSPKTVADTLRHKWSVNEDEWPDVSTVEEYYAPIPGNLPPVAIARGAEFEFGYQYIPNTPASIKQWLLSSPVCIAVTAWQQEGGVYTRIAGIVENHWTTIIKVLDNGNYKVFDSFPPFIKEVSPDACKSIAMSYYLDKQVVSDSLFTKFIKAILALFAKAPATAPVAPQNAPQQAQTPVPTPPTVPTIPPAPGPTYDWSTPEAARHSVRVIADEEGLNVEQKNTMCKVLACESGFHTKTVHPNLNSNGKVASTDYGIAQWNDYYHGKEISPDEAVNDPEKAVRLMCQYVKAGRINQWVCYSSNMYLNYPA